MMLFGKRLGNCGRLRNWGSLCSGIKPANENIDLSITTLNYDMTCCQHGFDIFSSFMCRMNSDNVFDMSVLIRFNQTACMCKLISSLVHISHHCSMMNLK